MILANVPAFYFGTSPNKFFDYIAQGLPVLNNYPGWLAEMIEAAKIGVVVQPDNPGEFADALEYLADNPDARLDMGRRARKFAEENFDRQVLSGKWVYEVERVVDQ
jgi:glycosyltransferase involved in cell wall biosynthesis